MRCPRPALLACLAMGLMLSGAPAAAARTRGRLTPTSAARAAVSRTHHRRWRERLHRARRSARASVIGGQAAAQGTWPFMAFVTYSEPNSTQVVLCSGTVISSNVVLTAGHCGVDESTGAARDPSGYRVVSASVDWTDTSRRQISSVSRVIVYPYYDPATKQHDAALLVLSTPTTAPAISLAAASHQALIAAGTPALIAGWGETYSGSPTPTDLQWASTTIQGAQYCAQAFANFDSTSELCALDYPYDSSATCNGDSGGPLIAAAADGTPVEVGITSYGTAGCDTTIPDVFTRADQIAAWAEGWARDVAPPPPAPSPPPIPSAPPPAPAAAPPLPRLGRAEARTYVRRTLAGAFGRRFKRGHAYRPRCARQGVIRFRCDVTWWYRSDDYWGRVSVYFVRGSANDVEWTDRYAIRRVNDRCYWHSHHRRRCHIHTARGSW